MPVPMTTKRQALSDRIQAAAERHVSHSWVMEQEHRLASQYNAVSRRDRRKVMVPTDGDVVAYCEVINANQQTIRTDTGGQAKEVAHSFDVWLAYEFVDGESKDTWDAITEGTDPDGVTTDLRQTQGYYSTPDGRILYQQPDFDYDIVPLGDDGGQIETAHVLRGTVRIDDFDR